MPFGNILTFEEFFAKNNLENLSIILYAPHSDIKDIPEFGGAEDLVVLTHRYDDGTLLHGTLVLEGGQEAKNKLLTIRSEKSVHVVIKGRRELGQTFLNLEVKDPSVEPGEHSGSENSPSDGNVS